MNFTFYHIPTWRLAVHDEEELEIINDEKAGIKCQCQEEDEEQRRERAEDQQWDRGRRETVGEIQDRSEQSAWSRAESIRRNAAWKGALCGDLGKYGLSWWGAEDGDRFLGEGRDGQNQAQIPFLEELQVLIPGNSQRTTLP